MSLNQCKTAIKEVKTENDKLLDQMERFKAD